MRWSVAFAAVLALLTAGECLAAEPVTSWLAVPILELTRSSTNCGVQWREPVRLALDGHFLHTSAWSRTTYDIELLEPLKADGSGQVYAVSWPHHQSLVLSFEPGQAKRRITYWHRYNARCVWIFTPIEET